MPFLFFACFNFSRRVVERKKLQYGMLRDWCFDRESGFTRYDLCIGFSKFGFVHNICIPFFFFLGFFQFFGWCFRKIAITLHVREWGITRLGRRVIGFNNLKVGFVLKLFFFFSVLFSPFLFLSGGLLLSVFSFP